MNLAVEKLNIRYDMFAYLFFFSYQKSTSPKKRRNSSEGHYKLEYPPLVIMLEDIEAFSPHVLQDFISICRY